MFAIILAILIVFILIIYAAIASDMLLRLYSGLSEREDLLVKAIRRKAGLAGKELHLAVLHAADCAEAYRLLQSIEFSGEEADSWERTIQDRLREYTEYEKKYNRRIRSIWLRPVAKVLKVKEEHLLGE